MTGVCPDCGSPLPKDAALMGLCPQCLLSMALEDEESETLHGSSPGGILGERYQIREVLGRGGMGEVYRAFDLKLRVDVALKSVKPELSTSEKARELLRQEVRSAREVVSPNVCRIFDLVVEEGRELVSMEYIDGTTLAEVLRERRPLELREAREISAQFLSGLEAIHEAGLVHRDFKPENVMLTRAGRVVVMDFGLAKAGSEKSGTIAGTPAYMSPEQSKGEPVDARSDVFSAGVVLAEMLMDGARDAVWQAVREVPPRVAEGPWKPVLRQALASDREARYPTARALARALDEVTHRLPGFEDKHPYPGLASFTQEEAEYFFGREVEIEAVWRKLKRPRLLALIGPSGAGKSSFLRAGLLPTLPPGWQVVLSTPGHRPFSALAETLLPAFAGDMPAIQSFLRFDEPETAVSLFSAWRHKREHGLVIVDQFEELFTLNPPEVQEAFATLLAKLVLEADVHVLLSLRDDFLFHCQKHEPLSPVFSELTPLGTLSPSALRRALVQPALACGYRFEDEALVEEMVSEVSHERGVLPLLAFAASRLWEKRDRERGLLTRAAYREIGGVGGALAQHAEEILERIGSARTPIVRELFRNLMTAQGTRASREVHELLSIFPKEDERRAAEEVVRELVAARLLTSYETSVEIIHESLLTAWPRLVRWQTQDADGALLRDQLRQAAHLWEERGRSDDLLWTGSSYREFTVWRERYAGGLSTTEEDFARAMARKATRQRRRKRIAVSAVLVFLTVGLLVVGGLWRKSETQALRAEASRLLALGQLELERHPTQAVAYATRSLELADSDEARRFALQVLQGGPVARRMQAFQSDGLETMHAAFSPNGEWIAIGGYRKAQLRRRDGSEPVLLDGEYPSLGHETVDVGFARDGRTLVTNRWGHVRLWSVPSGSEIRGSHLENGPSDLFVRRDGFFTLTTVGDEEVVRFWPFGEVESRLLGRMDALTVSDVDPSGTAMAYGLGRKIYVRSLVHWDSGPELFAEHAADVRSLRYHPDGAHLAASDASGEIRIWSLALSSDRPVRILRGTEQTSSLRYSPTGRWLVGRGRKKGLWILRLWDLTAPSGSAPLELRTDSAFLNSTAFDPDESWLASLHADHVWFWPLGPTYARVLEGHEAPVMHVQFTPDGKTLLSSSNDGTLRAWPLGPETTDEPRVLLTAPMTFPGIALHPKGTKVAISVDGGRVLVVPLAGGLSRTMDAFSEEASIVAVAISPNGLRIAAAPHVAPAADKFVRVWTMETGALEVEVPIPGAGEGFQGAIQALRFIDNDRLLAGSANDTPIILFNLHDETAKKLHQVYASDIAFSLKSGFGFAPYGDANGDIVRFDLEGGAPLSVFHHSSSYAVALNPDETLLASGGLDGTVRVGPISGAEPHLFFGHQGMVRDVLFSPDGKWLASAGEDRTIRLWPVPDVREVPRHTRIREDFLTMLRSWTNLRLVPEPNSPTGWGIKPEPFPGWSKLPDR